MKKHPALKLAPMLALAVLTAACGSSSPAATGNSPTAATPTAAAPGGGGNFCQAVRDQLNGFAAVFPKDFSSADQLKAYGAYLDETNAKLRATAPSELKDSIEVQTRVSSAQAAAYKNGVQPSRDVVAQLRTPEFQDASRKLSAYTKDKCGIDPSASTGG
jgi:hypothetical protein